MNVVLDKISNKMAGLSYAKLFLLLFAARLPYLLFFFPGLMIYDTGDSIQQLYGFASETIALSANPSAILSNHHLIVFTYLFGGFIKIGDLLGNQNIGLFLYAIFQVILSSAVIIYVLNIVKRKCSLRGYCFCLITYVLFPIISLWIITMGKDPIYSIFVLWLCAMLYQIADSNCEVLHDKKFLLLFILCVCSFTFSKQQSSYISIIISIVLFVMYKKRALKAVFSLTISAIFYLYIFTGLILPAFNIASSGKQEIMGFMFQQTASAVIEHSDQITSDEKAAISNLLPYDQIEELYNPYKQDSLKFQYNQYSTSKQNKEYIETWFKMFFKYPMSYIKATALNFEDFIFEGETTDSFIPKLPEKNGPLRQHPEVFNLHCINPYASEIRSAIQFLSNLPVLTSFSKPPLYVWSTIVLGLLSVFKRKKEVFVSMLPLLITLLVLIVSPVVSFRYVLPLVFTLPFILSIYLYKN